MRRRLFAAMALAVVLAGSGVVVMNIPAPNFCAELDPDGWMYWLLGCHEATGGGGSGAGMD